MEARKLEEIEDGLLIDPETGELIDESRDTFTATDPGEIKCTSLPKLARAIRSIQRQVDRLAEYQTAEMQRVQAITQHRIDTLTNQRNHILTIAQGMFDTVGEKKLEYPGLGVYRRVKGRESVNDEEYAGFDDSTKASIQQSFPNLFKTKTVVSPDKKALADALKSSTVPPPGFSLNEAQEKFEFKVEV